MKTIQQYAFEAVGFNINQLDMIMQRNSKYDIVHERRLVFVNLWKVGFKYREIAEFFHMSIYSVFDGIRRLNKMKSKLIKLT